jgi:hypothetical protein
MKKSKACIPQSQSWVTNSTLHLWELHNKTVKLSIEENMGNPVLSTLGESSGWTKLLQRFQNRRCNITCNVCVYSASSSSVTHFCHFLTTGQWQPAFGSAVPVTLFWYELTMTQSNTISKYPWNEIFEWLGNQFWFNFIRNSDWKWLCHRVDNWGTVVCFPTVTKLFPLLQSTQTDSAAQPASYSSGYWRFFSTRH